MAVLLFSEEWKMNCWCCFSSFFAVNHLDFSHICQSVYYNSTFLFSHRIPGEDMVSKSSYEVAEFERTRAVGQRWIAWSNPTEQEQPESGSVRRTNRSSAIDVTNIGARLTSRYGEGAVITHRRRSIRYDRHQSKRGKISSIRWHRQTTQSGERLQNGIRRQPTESTAYIQ